MKQRRCPLIQLCPRCGEMRSNHGPDPWACPVDDGVIVALKKYRDANGSRWKARLCEEWGKGTITDDGLARAKIQIGPRRLYKIDLDRTTTKEQA